MILLSSQMCCCLRISSTGRYMILTLSVPSKAAFLFNHIWPCHLHNSGKGQWRQLPEPSDFVSFRCISAAWAVHVEASFLMTAFTLLQPANPTAKVDMFVNVPSYTFDGWVFWCKAMIRFFINNFPQSHRQSTLIWSTDPTPWKRSFFKRAASLGRV